jgi:DNA-binding response OmpR family regulator
MPAAAPQSLDTSRPDSDPARMHQRAAHRALLVGTDHIARELMCARELIRTHVRGLNFEIHESADGQAALGLLWRNSFDLIVIDELLSDLDGFAVCRAIRGGSRNAKTPIVLLVTQGGVADITLGLASGADHCVPRTVDARELSARLGALLRRTLPAAGHISGQRRLFTHGIAVDPEQRSVSVRGDDVYLTVQEFALLHLLMSRPGIVFSRAALLARIWPRDREITGRTVDSAISRLRAKIERTDTPNLLITVWGIGYKFTAD